MSTHSQTPSRFLVPSFTLRAHRTRGSPRSQLHGHPWRAGLTIRSALFLQSRLFKSQHYCREIDSASVRSSIGGGLRGQRYQSLSQLTLRLPDEGQALILILFSVFLRLLGIFIPPYFLNNYGFNDHKPLRPAEFREIIIILNKNNFIGFRDTRTLEAILLNPLI